MATNEAYEPAVPRARRLRTILAARGPADRARSRNASAKRVIHLDGQVDARTRASPRIVGARHHGQLQPVDEVVGGSSMPSAKAEIIGSCAKTVHRSVGPEFMPRRHRSVAALTQRKWP